MSSSANMISSPKPRSGSSPQKLSNSKPTKGLPSSSNVDANAPKIAEKRPSKITVSSPEKRIVRVSEIQQQLSQVQEELQRAKDQLVAAEEEKDRLLDELREMKKVSDDANLKLSEALLAHKKVEESSNIEKSRVEEWEQASIESAKKRDQAWQLEIDTLQKEHDVAIEALSFSTRELKEVRKELLLTVEAKNRAIKEAEDANDVAEENAKRVEGLSIELNYVKELLDSNGESETKEAGSVVESLKLQLEKTKYMESRLAESESLLEKLNLELSYARESEARAINSLSENKMIVDELEVELEKAKESETKMLESLTSQTKQLEEAKISLEEAKLEIISLQENIEILEVSKAESSRDFNLSHQKIEAPNFDEDSGKILNSTLQIANENLVGAQQKDEFAISNSHSAAEEMAVVRAELKSAMEAEEKSKEAMDNLALALKEVTLEANEVKEKLASTQSELQGAKMEAEHLKLTLEGREERFEVLLYEAKKEMDRLKEEMERLKLEAEESVNAWNEKVLNLVNYLKMCEEELTDSKQENDTIVESLRKAEELAKATKEENLRLRDILKQAVNEATAAKEASQIARTENSQLKDNLSDKDSELRTIEEENESLKVKEAAALESVKKLKRLLGEASTMELSKNVGISEASKAPNSVKELNDSKKLVNHPSQLPKKPEVENKRYRDEYKNATLNSGPFGSAFSMVASPNQDDRETITSDDFDHIDRTHYEEMDNGKVSPTRQRKKKALLRRFGDMLRKRSNYK